MKLIAGALTIALLSGCSVMGTKEDPRVQERALYTELQTKLQNQQFIAPSYTMDVGYGSTPEAARADAQKRLASQVIVSVQSYRKSDKSFDNGNFTSSESAAAYSFSTIQLEDARIFDSGVVDETYYVVLGVDSEMTEKMRREARRKLPVLSIIERLKATESPVKRINIATEGINEARAAGVADEQVIVRDIEGEQTFEDYFKYTISRSLSDLDLAYEFKGSYTRITLFDKFSYQPIGAGLPLEVAGKVYKTDVNGAILVENLAINDAIFVSSYEKIFLDNFTLLSDTGKIYVATEPEGAEVEIYEGDDLVENFASPGYFNARYFADSTKYRIKIIPEGDYSEYETTVTLKRGYDVFVNQEFAKKTYGTLNIEPKAGLLGSSTLITIEDGYGKRLVDRSPEGYQGEAVSGRYTVRVEDDSLDEKYQVIEDSFILREDRKIEREYLAPIDREYSRGGTGFNWGFRFGRSIQTDTELTVGSSTMTAAQYNDLANKKYYSDPIDVTGTSFSFYGAVEKFTTNLFFGAEAEWLLGGQNDYYASSSSSTHSGFGGGAYAGIYGELGSSSYWTLGGGYSFLTVSSEDEVPYAFEADLSSTFGEARVIFGNSFGLSARYYPELGSSSIGLIFWGTDIEDGYKYPASVEARQGKHY